MTMSVSNLGLCCRLNVQAIDLVFNAFGMLDKLGRVFVESCSLFFGVFVIGAEVVGNLDEPHSYAVP